MKALDTVLVHGESSNEVSPSFEPRRAPRTVGHAISEFSQGVTCMIEGGERPEQLGELVKELTTALHEHGEKQGQLKIHPLVYANLVFIAGLIFSSGVLYQRINELERRQYQMQGVEGMAPKVEAMQQEVTRLRDRLDRFFDEERVKTKR